MNERSPDEAERVVTLVKRAMDRRRQALVHELARVWYRWMREQGSTGAESPRPTDDNGWTRVESLSQLRALVGGRFQNLKEKWVAAGFPLREHRGDRSGQKVLDYDGWVALALWVQRQGFEVRLATESDAWLFEIRAAADRPRAKEGSRP